MHIATAAQLEALHRFRAAPDIERATRALDAVESRSLCPVLREDYVAGAVYEPDCSDIDVAGLHQGYLRLFRAREGRLVTNAEVHALARTGNDWSVRAGSETYRAPLLINAAGAWADSVAALAGIAPIGLEPRRRTAVLVDPPPGMAVAAWPFVSDIEERFYFKPEAGSLFLSPADETPSPPVDAQPDEWDVATAVERMETATTLQIDRLKARWAGLRTFAADRVPVVGFGAAPGFFWLAGQGGYGIQTSPALGRAAAALALGLPLPPELTACGVEAAPMSPIRFYAAAQASP